MHIYNSVVGLQMWNILQCFTAFWFCVSVMCLNYLPQRIFKDNLGVYVFRGNAHFPRYVGRSVCVHKHGSKSMCFVEIWNWRHFWKSVSTVSKSCNYRKIICGNLHEDIRTFVFWTAVRTILWLDNTVKWIICCVSKAINVAGECIDISLFVNWRSC